MKKHVFLILKNIHTLFTLLHTSEGEHRARNRNKKYKFKLHSR